MKYVLHRKVLESVFPLQMQNLKIFENDSDDENCDSQRRKCEAGED